MKYTAFLVDNEAWALVYLERSLSWEENGFSLLGSSVNSVEALDTILRLKPDAVITDIRMPELSGLELMEKAHQAGLVCEFVLLSGFPEFSYAQEAVRLGAFEYCLKPISPQQGNELLGRLRERLDARKGSESPRERPARLSGNETLDRILQYIQEHYQEKLRLKGIADRFYLSPGYCSALFSKHLGRTFPEYLTELRVGLACRLLSDTHLSIHEIASQTGIDDSFYFSKVFKRAMGVTPGQYRRQRRQDLPGEEEER